MSDGQPRSRISTFDLGVFGRELAGSYACSIKWVLHLPLRKDSGIALLCRVVAVRPAGPGDSGNYERGVSGAYPASGGRTLVGELYRITWELEKKLSDEAEEAARAKQNRLPL